MKINSYPRTENKLHEVCVAHLSGTPDRPIIAYMNDTIVNRTIMRCDGNNVKLSDMIEWTISEM